MTTSALPPINIGNFLYSLASALAGLTGSGLTLPAANLPPSTANLFVNQAVETTGPGAPADPYVVLRCYGGPPPVELLPIDVISVQAMTHSKFQDGGLQFARKVFELFFVTDANNVKKIRAPWIIAPMKLDGNGALILDSAIEALGVDGNGGGYEIRVIKFHQVPGLVGVDPDTRIANVPFNFDIKVSLSAAPPS